jgi:2-polyprenyl-3-methyl-5-hydroxy-6-metoxy-1,4-benzoquinol methylase
MPLSHEENMPIQTFDDLDMELVEACYWCGKSESRPWSVLPQPFQTVVCNGCELIYVNKRLNLDARKRFFSDYPSSIHNVEPDQVAHRRIMYQQEFDQVDTIVGGGNVLDVGCGDGSFLDLFADAGYGCTGLEFGTEAAHLAGRRHTVLSEDLDSYTPSITFDLIVFRGVIQYLPDPRTGLNKAVDMLSPSGSILISSTPNTASVCCLLYGDQWNLFKPEEMVSYFRKSHFDEFFDEHKMRLGLESYPYPETPYAHIENDFLAVAERIRTLGGGQAAVPSCPPFWGNMMTLLYSRRPERESSTR